MEQRLQDEILRSDPELFAWPKCYIRETPANLLGISEEAKDALLEEYVLPQRNNVDNSGGL